jgi:hypothetical protein
MHYGLFNNDNSPKLAATALHDLTTILADKGANAASFQPGTLNYTQTGGTSADHAMLLETSNGVFDLALWNDADPGTASSDPLTISFGQAYQNVTLYDVVTDASTSYQDVSQLNVNVGGDAMIIQIDPNQNETAITASLLNQMASMGFLAAGGTAASAFGGGLPVARLLAEIQPVTTGPALSSTHHGGVQNGIFTHSADASPMAVVASMIAKLKG